MTNSQYAASDKAFQEACKKAGIPPSRRQASKFKLGFGKAWEHRGIDNVNVLRVNDSPNS
jgi:hypothetical protein